MAETITPREAFSMRLREARLRADLSQNQLGVLAGIDEFVAGTRINRYERGVHEPDFATAQRLADALAVPLSYFFATDDHEADWILAFHVLTRVRRQLILDALEDD